MSRKILVVDDDVRMVDLLCFNLQDEGFTVQAAHDGTQVLEALQNFAPDIVLLDVMMPGMNGYEIGEYIKTNTSIPILFLTSCDDEIEVIKGLKISGGHYVVKMPSVKELVTRIECIIASIPPPPSTTCNKTSLQRGALSYDKTQRYVKWEGQEVVLTALELSIIQGLMQHPQKVFTKEDIIALAYSPNTHYVTDENIRNHIKKIRNKFSTAGNDNIIETIRNIGYRLGKC